MLTLTQHPMPQAEHTSMSGPTLQSLAKLAIALESEVGPAPAVLGWTKEAAKWHTRYRRAIEVLADECDRDAEPLRLIAGPPWDEDGPRPAGTMLAINAALTVERGN